MSDNTTLTLGKLMSIEIPPQSVQPAIVSERIPTLTIGQIDTLAKFCENNRLDPILYPDGNYYYKWPGDGPPVKANCQNG